MATLEKIRQRGVLLTVIIGGALLAFIIGGIDFTTMRQGARETVAVINGEEIKIADYQQRIDEMTTFYKIEMGQSTLTEEYIDQINNSVWTTWSNEQLIGKQAENLGLTVTDKELADAVYGDNVHPIFYSIRMFYNNEGAFDRSLLLQFLNSISQDTSGEAAKYWNFIERMLKNNLLEEKYYTLVSSSFNSNNIDAKYAFDARTKNTGLEFVVQPYFTLADSLFQVTDKEIKQRYNDEQAKYSQHDETREIVVVSFDIKPSEQDFQEVQTWIEKLKNEFATSNEYVAIANQNSDIPNNDIAVSRNNVDADLKDFAFSAAVGDIFGPIFVNGAYKMARLYEKGIVSSDSAKVRHILVQETTVEATQKLADSLFSVLKGGGDFAAVAQRYSKAGTNAQGGEIGWIKEGELDKDFSKAAINAQINELFTVKLGNGIHIVQVTEKTKPIEKVKLATIIRKVESSSRTFGVIYNQASQYIVQNRTAEKFESSATAENGLSARKYTVSAAENRIANLKDSRQIIRWAFEKKEGDVTDKVFESGEQFIVAALKTVNPVGVKPLKNVTEQIKAELIKEKKADKLATELSTKLAQTNDINSLGLPLQVVESVTFDSPFIPSMGREPKVLGNLVSLIQTQKPKVIKGNAGVFVVQSVNVGGQPEFNVVEETKLIQQKIFNQNTLVESLKRSAEIQDNRIRFY